MRFTRMKTDEDNYHSLYFGSEYGKFFVNETFFWICLSQNGSMNIKFDETIDIYFDRTNILV